MMTLKTKDVQRVGWVIDQLYELSAVAEVMRAWTVTQKAAGNLSEIDVEAVEHHIILLAKIRELGALLSDTLADVLDGSPDRGVLS